MMTKKQIGTLFLAGVMAASMLISFPLASHAASRPTAPTLKVHVHPSNKVDLKWNKVKADSYKIYRKQDQEKKYTLVKKTVKTKETVKNKKTSSYLVKSVYKGTTSKTSNKVNAYYDGHVKTAVLPNTGKRITVGKTYPASALQEYKSGRTIKVTDIEASLENDYIIFGVDAKTKGFYSTPVFPKSSKRYVRTYSFRYDALSTYKKDNGVDRSKKSEQDYFTYLGNFDDSSYFIIHDPSIVVYETIDGTAPTPNNYYMKITKADGHKDTFAWGYYKEGYEWFRAYKNGKLMWEEARFVPSWAKK